MGHKEISVLQRYLHQTHQDTEKAHRKASPVVVGFHAYYPPSLFTTKGWDEIIDSLS
jgi:hypothetical protein